MTLEDGGPLHKKLEVRGPKLGDLKLKGSKVDLNYFCNLLYQKSLKIF